MKQFARVLTFSFNTIARSKGMIASTLILCVVIAVAMSIPTLMDMFKSGEPEPLPGADTPSITGEEAPADTKNTVIVVDPEGLMFRDRTELSTLFPDYEWKLENADRESLIRQIEDGIIHSALIVTDRMNAEYIVNANLNVFGSNLSGQLQSYLTDTYRYELLLTYQVKEEDAARFFQTPMVTTNNVGLKSMIGQVQSMFFILLLYIAILSSGQMVAMSVTQEKSSRAMEVLITTTRPETLMFGKVIGIGLAGLGQMLVMVATAVAFYFVNREALFSIEVLKEMLSIPLSTFLFALLFFLGGYFFYAMLFAAVGSLISRTEDLATANMPMTLLSVAGFMVSIYGQLYGFADTLFYKVLSYVPLTSPYVMLARVCSEPNFRMWEVLISLVLLYATTLLAGVLSAKIYRIGVLIYGKRPSFKEVFTALRQA